MWWTVARATRESTFLGPGEECASLTELLRCRRLVTVSGPAGIGMSRLACEVGERCGAVGADAAGVGAQALRQLRGGSRRGGDVALVRRIHFRRAIEQGLVQGARVGDAANRLELRR